MTSNTELAKQERFFRRDEASEYLEKTWHQSYARSTLAKMAVTGGGPEFRKAGRTPLYPQDGLDTFALKKLSPRVRSTSEFRALVAQRPATSTPSTPGGSEKSRPGRRRGGAAALENADQRTIPTADLGDEAA
jgi:hypothetical protein